MPNFSSRLENSVKKQFREHLLIQNMYSEKLNYVGLAKQLGHRRKKSSVGLPNQYNSLVKKAMEFKYTRPSLKKGPIRLQCLDKFDPDISKLIQSNRKLG